uniref:Uncharacterized protein n=1 Tax=Heterorhabditis bacteriophora TaxID=37862 RepID=A0A1I7WQY1_HETBA
MDKSCEITLNILGYLLKKTVTGIAIIAATLDAGKNREDQRCLSGFHCRVSFKVKGEKSTIDGSFS